MSDMDRFVDFLRRVAAEYNSPPPTPRDEIWGHIEASVFAGDTSGEGTVDAAVSSTFDESAPDADMDRFVEFLRPVAVGYNAPPPTPRDDIWEEIESTLALQTPESLETGETLEAGEHPDTLDDPLSGAADLYNAPPSPPQDEMWGRIEAAWEMRRSAGPAAREAGLEPLPAQPVPDLSDTEAASPKRDRRRALMITGLAVAASLVIGIAIGRRSAEQLQSDSTPTTIAQSPPGAAGASDTQTPGELARAQDPGAQAREPGGETPSGEPGRAPGDARSETLETAPRPGAQLAATESPQLDTAPGGSADMAVDRASRQALAVHYATAEHLGRAEALLTSFRTEPSAGNGQVSRWARELLAETRLLMDLPNGRDPRTTALLLELELVLASIAGLGEDAPTGERAFIADGLDQQGTLPRLRAALPSGPAGAGRVGT